MENLIFMIVMSLILLIILGSLIAGLTPTSELSKKELFRLAENPKDLVGSEWYLLNSCGTGISRIKLIDVSKNDEGVWFGRYVFYSDILERYMTDLPTEDKLTRLLWTMKRF